MPSKYSYSIEKILKSSAKRYNTLLDEYKLSEAKYLFVVEDNLEVENELFEQYILLMEKYDVPCVFYAYAGDNNLFNGKCNPMARCTLKDETILITRNPGTSIVGFDLEKIKDRRFDDNLQYLFLDYFLFQLHNDKLIPFFGFFIDVNNPWEKIKKDETIRYCYNRKWSGRIFSYHEST